MVSLVVLTTGGRATWLSGCKSGRGHPPVTDSREHRAPPTSQHCPRVGRVAGILKYREQHVEWNPPPRILAEDDGAEIDLRLGGCCGTKGSIGGTLESIHSACLS
jgi:hypothetical protein